MGKIIEKLNTNRIPPKAYRRPDLHWAEAVALAVLEKFPDREIYTVAAGISPSGTVHFGNFRDVATSYAVMKALEARGKKTRFVFSWDDFDRLRKVPANVPENFAEHVGKPLAKVPDPKSQSDSYARSFEEPFEKAMQELGLPLQFIRQSEMYGSGKYAERIKFALGKREHIARIILSGMTDVGKENKGIDEEKFIREYFPISVYSRFTDKDSTKVLEWNGETKIRYYCAETKKEDEIDFATEGRVKLVWKVDWPMRWAYEGVVFEPGGKDHANPGSSYDVGCRMMREIFEVEPPMFVGYEFVGIRGLGAKMSGSLGNAISPSELLQIYEPALLLWLYTRAMPDAGFQLAFDSEIYRQYDEFDRECEVYRKGGLEHERAFALEAAGVSIAKSGNPLPFRQCVAYGQIFDWQAELIVEKLGLKDIDIGHLTLRLQKAKNWLMKYNPDEAVILRDMPNKEYWNSMTESAQENIKKLVALLDSLRSDLKGPQGPTSSDELEEKLYDIPKPARGGTSGGEVSKLQRAFFKDVYMLLIGRDTGPRLATFLSALDKDRVKKLLLVLS